MAATNQRTYIRDGFVSAGNAQVTGSLGVTRGITGSLLGTASYAVQALSASYAPSAGGSGTVNSGVAGYVAYYPSTTTTVDDTNGLYWDQTNSRLGIGTTTPAAVLDVNGNAVITGTLLVSGEKLVAGYNATPLQGSIQDGITSVLGSLADWDSDYYQGTVLYSETAGGTITFGQLCYRRLNQTWALADATAFGTAAINMLGICVKSATSTEPTSILINGFVETTNYATVSKSGEPLYIDSTAGSMTKTAPATAGNIVRLIGHTFWDSGSPYMYNNKTVIHFNPENSWIEL